MSINLKTFWNTSNVNYYREEDNSGDNFYKTYESFASDSKSDSVLKNFKFYNNFNHIPSYGSSVDISFLSSASVHGHGYIMQDMVMTNRIIVRYNLRFDSKSNEKTKQILDFIDDNGGYKDFAMQSVDRFGLSDSEAYKSLFSMRPYMIQNFVCSEKNISQNYVDNNSISLVFKNNDFSQFDFKNILYAECLPQSRKDIINEYLYKRNLDIKPSYTISRDETISRFESDLKGSRKFLGWDSKNPHRTKLQLRYDNIDDDSLLKIVSLVIGCQGFESFTFKTDDSGTQNVNNFLCQQFTHTFVYNGVHSISLDLESTNVKRTFK